MKLVFLTDGIYPIEIGGMQKYAFHLIQQLARFKVEVVVYHFSTNPEANASIGLPFSEDELSYLTIRRYDFPKQDPLPGHYLRASQQMANQYAKDLALEKGYDAIIVHGLMGWGLFQNSKSINKPVLLHFHGYEFFQPVHGFLQKQKQKLLQKAAIYNASQADYLISLGGRINDLIQAKFPTSKRIECANGIDENWISKGVQSTDANYRKMVFIGRNEPRKGFPDLMRMMQTIKQDNFELHCIGPFNSEEYIFDSRIVWHGLVRDERMLQEILDEMDVLLLPSWSEGMPTVLLEAMARGCTSIAYDVGAVSELVNLENGWLVQAGSENAFKYSMLQFLKEPAERIDARKQKALQKVREQFTWRSLVKRFILNLEEAINTDHTLNEA